jgi:hypothetical protein
MSKLEKLTINSSQDHTFANDQKIRACHNIMSEEIIRKNYEEHGLKIAK